MYKTASALLIAFLIVFPARATDYFETAGDIGQYALPAAALGTALLSKDWKGCLQFGEAFLATLAVSYGLKYSVKESRPDGGGRSFPSGHTSSAFCGATFLDIRYGPAWGVPAYILASLVGWSRIESDNHYPLDVIAGAAIGVVSNIVFTRQKVKKIQIVPYVDDRGVGAVMTYKW